MNPYVLTVRCPLNRTGYLGTMDPPTRTPRPWPRTCQHTGNVWFQYRGKTIAGILIDVYCVQCRNEANDYSGTSGLIARIRRRPPPPT